MARSKKSSKSKAYSKKSNSFQTRDPDEVAKDTAPLLHVYANGAICDTDTRGYATPNNSSPLELAVDASEGVIPLWDKHTTLRWRFQEHSMNVFVDPDAAKAAIRQLFGEALLGWGDASPVKFAERADAWDFEIVMREADRCSINGCVLASAFFPDPGRHELVLYPQMFSQSREEMVETLAHEIGHVFGLRHFFANISETAWPSEIFGDHSKFSIMNYGPDSKLTATDKIDLKLLYQKVWTGEIADINGTPIQLMTPFSAQTAHV